MSSNICNYQPIQSISTKAIDMRFKRVHNALCHLTSQSSGGIVSSVGISMPLAFNIANSPITGSGTIAITGAGTTAQYIRGDGTLATLNVTTATNGLSVSSGSAVLGQAVGEVGAPATLTSSREIPTAGFNVALSGTGNLLVGTTTSTADKLRVNGTARFLGATQQLIFDSTGFGGSAAIKTSSSFLNFYPADGTVVFNGGTTAGAIPALQISTGDAVANASIQLKAFNFNSGNANRPFIIYTTGSGNTMSGDIRIQAGMTNGAGSHMAGAYSIIIESTTTGTIQLLNGNVGVKNTSPTAFLHLGAGTTTASTAPLKFTSGTNNTTAEAGAMEYDGTNLFFTRVAATRENVLTGNSGASAPATTPADSSEINSCYGTTGTFLGIPNSWISVVIGGSTFKIPLYS
jgi:hypothetical protein